MVRYVLSGVRRAPGADVEAPGGLNLDSRWEGGVTLLLFSLDSRTFDYLSTIVEISLPIGGLSIC